MKEESLRQGSMWMISGQGFSAAARAVYLVLIVRSLGSGEYGAFAGVAALVAVLSQFSSLGMEMILVRNISRDRASFARTWGQALTILAAGFVALLGATMLAAHFLLRPELRGLAPWIVLSDGLLGKLVQLAGRAFQGAGQLSWTARLTALMNLCRTAAAGAVWVWARASDTRLTAYFWVHVYWIATLIAAAMAAYVVTTQLGWPRFERMGRADLMEGLSFSISSSSISIYNDIDKTILVSLGEIYATGIYTAAYRVVDAATAPIFSVYAAATPRFFRAGAESVQQAAAFSRRTMAKTMPYAVLATAAMWVAAPLLPVVFGASFTEAETALRWLCLLPVLRALHYGWGTAITGSASQWNRTATQLGAAALNVALDVALIPRWSWRGAAAASVATDAALALFSYAVLRRLLRREAAGFQAEGGAEPVAESSRSRNA